jgi:hypothetical protein
MENRNFERWTQDEYDKIHKMFNCGMTYSEISNEIGRTKKSVKVKLNKLGYSQLERDREKQKEKVYEKITCLNCKKEFVAYKRHKQKFCSQSCNASYNNRKIKRTTEERKKAVCIHCGKKIMINKYASLKYASCLECNPNYGKKGSWKYTKGVEKIKDKFICINCGKELTKRAKYCSHNCQNEFRRNEIFKKIESGNLDLNYKHYKKYLIHKYGEKCMECGWDKVNKYSGKIPIEIEHIDGNSENNDLKNLKLLCPNCHSLTPTYKGLNAGNGRYKRRERYKNNKSY